MKGIVAQRGGVKAQITNRRPVSLKTMMVGAIGIEPMTPPV